jgi:hypothetical protein
VPYLSRSIGGVFDNIRCINVVSGIRRLDRKRGETR